MAKQTSGYINRKKIANSGTHNLFYELFEPINEPPKATVLILHGMQEHSGRYKNFAEYLANNGFAVLLYDHLGHGKTAENLEDLGYFQKENPKQQLIDDAATMAAFLKDHYPNISHFLLGHSMGSFIARCLLQNQEADFKGAVIVGTGGKINGIGVAKFFLSINNIIAPKHRSKFINQTFSKINNQHFKDEKDSDLTSWLSLSKCNRESFCRDSLCGVPFTNNGFYALVSLNQQATERKWAEKLPKEFPFLFVSGADDPIGDFGKGVKKTVTQMQKDGFTDVKIKIYPAMRHEILNEDIKESVYESIKDWLYEKILKTKKYFN